MKNNVDMTNIRKEDVTESLIGSPVRNTRDRKPDVVNVFVQTTQACNLDAEKTYKTIETNEDKEFNKAERVINDLRKELEKKNIELADSMKLVQKRTQEMLALNSEKHNTESTIQNIKDSNRQKDRMNKRLQNTVDDLRTQIDIYKQGQVNEKLKMKEMFNEENKTLLDAMKKFESDKNAIVAEYKELLNNERNQYAKCTKELQMKILDLEGQLLDRY